MLRYIMAVTDEEKRATFKSRFEVYNDEGYLDKYTSNDKLLKDVLDDLHTTQNFAVLEGKRAIATVRLLTYNHKIEKEKGWDLGLWMGQIYNLNEFKNRNISVAELPRSTIVKEYRGRPIMTRLWNKALRHASLLGTHHIIATALLDSTNDAEAWMSYQIMTAMGHLHTELQVTTKKQINGKNNSLIKCLCSQHNMRNNKPSKEDIEKFKLPYSINIYLRLGAKIIGEPVYFNEVNRYIIPLLLELKPNNLNQMKSHLIKKKQRRYVSWSTDSKTQTLVHLNFGDCEQGNTINLRLIHEMRDVFEEIKTFSKNQKDQTVVLLSPTPKKNTNTSSKPETRRSLGFDIDEVLKNDRTISHEDILVYTEHAHELVRAINDMASEPSSSLIIIGISNKELYGFSLEFYCGVCDFIFASQSSLYGLPEISLGITPGLGGLIYLERYLNSQRVRYLAFGNIIDAQKAVEWGLAIDVFPDETILENATRFSRKLINKSSYILNQHKQMLSPYTVTKEQSLQLQHQFYEAINREESVNLIKRYRKIKKKSINR